MWPLATFCDEFYVATRLFLKLELVPSRETVLHFFEQVRRAFPGMTRLRRRENGALVLDEDDQGHAGRRYLRLDSDALRLGMFSPPDRAAVLALAQMVFSHAPAHLSLSELDYDGMEVVYGFDLEYSGNHDALVAEALFAENPLLAAIVGDHRPVIDCQPCFGVALTDDYNTQAYVDVRGRTSMQELRSGDYEAQLLSVYLTLRQDFRDGPPSDLTAAHETLMETGEEIASARVIPHVVLPLRDAIASRR